MAIVERPELDGIDVRCSYERAVTKQLGPSLLRQPVPDLAVFVLAGNMVRNLANPRPPSFFATTGSANPPPAIAAVEEVPYLDPDRCR